MRVRVQGIGVRGPGLESWAQCAAILRGEAPYAPAPTQVPAASMLPPAERRRTTTSVKLVLACGLEAVQAARADAARLLSVFASSGGDSQNCHEICEVLAGSTREVSPTRFHNSVHNAPAGYWSIATGCMRASNVLCAFDASFAAGLLEAAVQCTQTTERVLLVAYDTPYPPPLRAKRPIADAFAVALLLAPESSGGGALLELRLRHAPVSRIRLAELDSQCHSIPAAAVLPLLERLAHAGVGESIGAESARAQAGNGAADAQAGAGDCGTAGEVVLPYLAPLHLAVTVRV